MVYFSSRSRLSHFNIAASLHASPGSMQVIRSPMVHHFEDRSKCLSVLRHRILDTRRNFRINRARDNIVLFQFTQLLRQNPLRDTRYSPHQFREAQIGLGHQMKENDHLPFPTDNIQCGRDKALVGRRGSIHIWSPRLLSYIKYTMAHSYPYLSKLSNL